VAVEAAKIIISAKDETRAAFESIKGNFAAVTGLASALGVGALAAAVKQAANFADEMQETAEKVGLTTRELSELKYAADINGDSFEALQTGLKRLSTTMLEFTNGNKQAQDLFKTLGIQVTDSTGKLRSSGDVLKEIADRFESLPNGAQKTALAIDLFGKSGAELIPLLNQGSAGMKRFADEAERFGLVVDDDAAAAAAQFNDNMDRLNKSFEGFKLQTATIILPALADISEAMTQAAKDSGLLAAAWVGLGGLAANAFGLDERSNAAERLSLVRREIEAINKTLASGQLGGQPLRQDFITKQIEQLKKLGIEQANLDAFLNPKSTGKKPTGDIALGTGTSDSSARKAIEGNASFAREMQELASLIQTFQKAAEGPISQTEDLQRQLDTFRALNPEVQTYLQGLVDQVAQRELLVKENEAWQRQQELNADFDARELQALEEQSAAELSTAKAMEDRALAIREMLDPQLKLLNLQQEYTELLDAGLLSNEEYTAGLKKLAEDQAKLADTGKTSMDDLKRAVEGTSKDAADALLDLAWTGETSFDAMVESMLKNLARLALQRSITDPIVKGLDESGIFDSIGSTFGSFFNFGGARANGGPVSSGKSYLVGERGPEIFMPSTSGSIIPNGGGGGVSVSVHVDAGGTKVQGDSDKAERVGALVGSLVREELLRQKRPGGML
jgi:hypothetical protein